MKFAQAAALIFGLASLPLALAEEICGQNICQCCAVGTLGGPLYQGFYYPSGNSCVCEPVDKNGHHPHCGAKKCPQ
ncbi:hypothetical protein TI39_contig4323g00004 [Zymoseptoria brevis]|uniref:Uncharacterized protein n=1 Tax=Zymoseptoria brevis TaxID=1047168 RepID=A0A0F4G7N1_9PEZI|nr:hypothetical protein TI39_contig4323g00004 [Zymoseptoria brevis]